VRWVLAGIALIALVVVVRRREEHAAAVRATRATIDTAFHALIAYRADHGGACPHDWNEMVAGNYLRDLPLDAWGHPLRLTCPGRRDRAGFDLESDGPDAIPGGLDRVE
jgi:general secretion pathway protein G